MDLHLISFLFDYVEEIVSITINIIDIERSEGDKFMLLKRRITSYRYFWVN